MVTVRISNDRPRVIMMNCQTAIEDLGNLLPGLCPLYFCIYILIFPTIYSKAFFMDLPEAAMLSK